jgi:cysteine dioxygenase
MAIDTQCEPLDSFQKLVKVLRDTLGPSSGINSDDIDERELQNLMKEYTSNESEWKKYYHPSPRPEVPYTRNLVDKGNGNSNLASHVSAVGKCKVANISAAHTGMVSG